LIILRAIAGEMSDKFVEGQDLTRHRIGELLAKKRNHELARLNPSARVTG
jgi:hypothetical protein